MEEVNISQVIDEFQTDLNEIKELLKSLKSVDETQMTPMQKAKFNFCFAYSASALFYCFHFSLLTNSIFKIKRT
jgi:hypothetical protein